MAPEVFSSGGYNEKVDIFSAGIILFTLFLFVIFFISVLELTVRLHSKAKT